MIVDARSFFLTGMVLVAGISAADAQLRPVERAPAAGSAPSQALIEATIGSFDLSNSKSSNTCRLMLHAEARGEQYGVAIPYGCRKAFPILLRVDAWTPGANGITLMTPSGQAILDFTQKESRLTTDARDEIVYELKPVDADWFQRRFAARNAKPPAVQPPAPIAPAALDAAARAEGRYAVLRSGSKPSGCELTLMRQPAPLKARIPAGAMKAGYVEGCQDRGMQIFDPVAWKTEKTTLTLYARKGHEIAFVYGDKSWHKAVASGEPLELEKR